MRVLIGCIKVPLAILWHAVVPRHHRCCRCGMLVKSRMAYRSLQEGCGVGSAGGHSRRETLYGLVPMHPVLTLEDFPISDDFGG